MASIQQTGNKYRVQVYIDGVRDSTTKATRQEAAQWLWSARPSCAAQSCQTRLSMTH
ncbi:hypothetical protein JH262_01660 [Xanthomonas campestris pv. incanae]|uniref:hypothetical protein n=1 Tax=Xanthomonas campestris TaxID=339 RepID=UPI0023683F15|nr:hypothetical protein [Xanthomonas campestris]WDJ98426.1 hypothetical protein JH262_01660 [Xanthomonas campestris pv. incanae]